MKRAVLLDHANNEIATSGGHGFGLRANNPQPAGKWIERFEEWLAERWVFENTVKIKTLSRPQKPKQRSLG